jgi:hypothetical protein
MQAVNEPGLTATERGLLVTLAKAAHADRQVSLPQAEMQARSGVSR